MNIIQAEKLLQDIIAIINQEENLNFQEKYYVVLYLAETMKNTLIKNQFNYEKESLIQKIEELKKEKDNSSNEEKLKD